MSTKKRSRDDSTDPASQARSYPRKRVSIACEVCRLRKTRCDAAKPACSFCSEVGIECVYMRLADAPRPDLRSEELTNALKRLEKMEVTLDTIASAIGANEKLHRAQTLSQPSPFSSTPHSVGNEQIPYSPASVSSVVGKSSKRQYAYKIPNLLSFKHPSLEHSDWSWNCTESFFNDQIETVSDMRQHINFPPADPDLSEPHLGYLQRSFVDHVLKWFPLLDPETASQHVHYAQLTEYRQSSSSLCLVFLIFANGEISADSSLYSHSARQLSGFAYYARAVAILERLPRTSKDLTALQCRVLMSIYLLYAMRPLEAWKHITQASQECILLLRANINRQASNEFRNAFRRIYWICYILENDLEASLEVPTSGIRTYEAMVPFPGSHYEEEGMYFLLALCALQKLMVEVLDAVGHKSTSAFVTYNPAVALELRTQLDEWYRHLPGPLRFQLDDSMLGDTRRAYLRCSYYILAAITSWPFFISLYKHTPQDTHTAYVRPLLAPTSHPSQEPAPNLHHQQQTESRGYGPLEPSSVHPPGDIDIHDFTTYGAAAESCLNASRSCLAYSEEILTQKSVVSHFVLRQCFTSAMILLLKFNGVDPQDGGVSAEDRRRLENALRSLRYWNTVPFMRESMNVLEKIAKTKGLRIA